MGKDTQASKRLFFMILWMLSCESQGSTCGLQGNTRNTKGYLSMLFAHF